MGHARPRIHSPIRTTACLYRSCAWSRQVRFFFFLLLCSKYCPFSSTLFNPVLSVISPSVLPIGKNSTHLIRWTHRLRPLWGTANRNRARYPHRLRTPRYHRFFKHRTRTTPPTRERRRRESRSQIRSACLCSWFYFIVAGLGSGYRYEGVEVGELCQSWVLCELFSFFWIVVWAYVFMI